MLNSSTMHIVRPTVFAPATPSTTEPCNVKIHSAAYFQILEIVSKQVISSDKRVMGSLLGYRSDDSSEFEIRDAFMVPCTQTSDSLSIDEYEHKMLFQLYKKAYPKEFVLGWFDCSDKIDGFTGMIYDFYSKGSDRAYPFPAIYLNVKYLSDNKEITAPVISAYIGAAIGKRKTAHSKAGWSGNSTANAFLFNPLPHKIVNGTVTEKLFINHLVENQNQSEPTSISAAERQASHLSNELNTIRENIQKLLKHIDSVSNSDADLDLLRYLSNSLLSSPKFLAGVEELESNFRAYNQDIIMVEYLTKAVKEQIELSARLTASSESERL